MEKLCTHLTDFHKFEVFFRKICRGSLMFHRNLTRVNILHVEIYVHLWYLTECFLECRQFQMQIVRKRQASDENMMSCTGFACRMVKVTDTRSEFIIIIINMGQLLALFYVVKIVWKFLWWSCSYLSSGGVAACVYMLMSCPIDAPAGAYKRTPPHHRKINRSNFIIGTFTLPEDGQVMTETCRRFSKF